jgi:hypothetical protein
MIKRLLWCRRRMEETHARLSTKDCLPIIRAKDETVEEVFPISALKRGNGYLVTAGMDTSGEKEADLFAMALNNFCAWFSKQL